VVHLVKFKLNLHSLLIYSVIPSTKIPLIEAHNEFLELGLKKFGSKTAGS